MKNGINRPRSIHVRTVFGAPLLSSICYEKAQIRRILKEASSVTKYRLARQESSEHYIDTAYSVRYQQVSYGNAESMSTSNNTSNNGSIIELNVGGVFYSTSIATLTSEPSSKLAKMFEDKDAGDTVLKDTKVCHQFRQICKIWINFTS